MHVASRLQYVTRRVHQTCTIRLQNVVRRTSRDIFSTSRDVCVMTFLPIFAHAPVACTLVNFSPVTPADVIKLVMNLPNKQCSSDPLPTWLLKNSIDLLAPFLCPLFNLSLSLGAVPSSYKSAYITPLLKKPTLTRWTSNRIDRFRICRHFEAIRAACL